MEGKAVERNFTGNNSVLNATGSFMEDFDSGLAQEDLITALPSNTSNASIFNSTLNSSDDDYFYDYDASISNIPLKEIIPVSLVYGLTLVLGVVGNLLVIFSIVKYRRMQNVTNTFLTSLASADLLLVLICVPIKFAKWFSFTWDFGLAMCKMVHYLQNVSVICSVLTLTTMSIERYYAIIHPMKAKYMCTVQRARRVCVAVWILSFILAVPIIFGQIHMLVGERYLAYWCLKQWPTPLASQLYELGMLALILIIPVIIMTFAYVSICRELWIVTHARASMRADVQSDVRLPMKSCLSSNHVGDRSPTFPRKRTKLVVDDDATRRQVSQVIKMLVLVICLFILCWAPSLIDNVLVAFGVLHHLHYGHLKHIRQAFALMSYFNSCVNPIVYAFMSKNFRESFKYALCVSIHGKKYIRKYRYSRQASFQTRSTSVTFTRTMSAGNAAFENELNDTKSLHCRLVTEPEEKTITDGDAML